MTSADWLPYALNVPLEIILIVLAAAFIATGIMYLKGRYPDRKFTPEEEKIIAERSEREGATYASCTAGLSGDISSTDELPVTGNKPDAGN